MTRDLSNDPAVREAMAAYQYAISTRKSAFDALTAQTGDALIAAVVAAYEDRMVKERIPTILQIARENAVEPYADLLRLWQAWKEAREAYHDPKNQHPRAGIMLVDAEAALAAWRNRE